MGTISNATWGGEIIPNSKGDTGNSSFCANQILLDNGSSSIVTLNPGVSGHVLMSFRSGNSPTFQNIY